MNEWWGYEHVNGSLHVKRFFDKRDLEEARESDFVLLVCGPFEARDRDHAFEILRGRLK